MNTSRRSFLRAASAMAAGPAARQFSAPFAMSLAGMAALASQSSAAANVSGPYRALVCLYMTGGNDSHNWIVPIDATGYAEYAASRSTLALPQSKLLPITCTNQGSGRQFGMPQELQALRDLYESGQAAVVANVGTLVRPLTKIDYTNNSGLPPKLFSHNDQTSEWQSMAPEGSASGWGGRMGDILMSANQNPVFTSISTTGSAVFLSGNSVTQYQVGAEGPVSVRGLSPGWKYGSSTGVSALGKILSAPGNNSFETEYTRVMQRSIQNTGTLQAALAGSSVPAIPASAIAGSSSLLNADPLAKQLRMVAQLVQAGQSLGMRRQVFMVSMNGFDTHANQMNLAPSMMSRVAQSISYFVNALNSIGMMDNVTLFTASDFGRTLTANGSGSDHGWGSHHFVAGGAVKGKAIYGRFPSTALGSGDDVGSGRLLPSTSVTQYAATLAQWMGLSSTEVSSVLPGISNFPAAPIGFV